MSELWGNYTTVKRR